jgi:hypothetical protein
MKSIKTKIMAVIVAASIFVPAVSVQAANLGGGLAKEQQILLNQQTRQQIQQLRTAIKNNEKTNLDLVGKNQGVRKAIREVVQQIKQSKKIIPAQDLNNIQAQVKTVKQDAAAIEATKSSMQTDRSAAKNDVQSKNWQDLINKLDNIISVQGTRTADLQQINKDLSALLSTLKTAQADITVPAASTTTTN